MDYYLGHKQQTIKRKSTEYSHSQIIESSFHMSSFIQLINPPIVSHDKHVMSGLFGNRAY